MLIITKYGTDSVSVIDVPEDADMELLAQMIQLEQGIPVSEQYLEFEGVPLQSGFLVQQGVVDGSSVLVKAITVNHMPLQDPFSITPERLLEIVQNNPGHLVQYKNADPELGACIESRDVSKLRLFIMKRAMSRHKQAFEHRQEEIALLTADPMDPETQRKIAEKIRMENVNENYLNAMENLPESFARVTMLYVNVQVNGTPLKAFVDSGAQITIMSKKCADQCGITHLIDTRMSTTLKGVGSSQSLGRIHAAQMRFGNSFLVLSITVVPNDDMEFLFGLDNLRRLRGVIDLDRNVLVLDGAGNKREEVSFLSESELPEHAKGNYMHPDEKDTASDGNSNNNNNVGDGKGSSKMEI